MPASAPTKQQQVYEVLRERILGGVYGPGFRVVIDQIAVEFAVSALPVREAIRRLEAEGLIVYRPNAGAQVAPAEPAQFEDNMTVLALLEGYATALAAPLLTARDLAALDRCTDDMVAAMGRMD
ncbi:MAG: GntR family transcriptional regulator, partial [Solirubrobacteraceae bacterium]